MAEARRRRVDRRHRSPLQFSAPVNDWLGFLARRLAADFLKEKRRQSKR
jgi:hypothetical protein